jgi:hypothetical protein
MVAQQLEVQRDCAERLGVVDRGKIANRARLLSLIPGPALLSALEVISVFRVLFKNKFTAPFLFLF